MRSRQSNPATTYFDAEPGDPVLVVTGGVNGSTLNRFADAMEHVLNSHSHRFVVDVSEVDEWSLAAQAMVLATARQKAARGEQLVLRGASPALQEQSRQLGLFEHIRSIDGVPDAGR